MPVGDQCRTSAKTRLANFRIGEQTDGIGGHFQTADEFERAELALRAPDPELVDRPHLDVDVAAARLRARVFDQKGERSDREYEAFVENEVRRQRGRMLLIETSSKESYGPTMRFYERSGYDEISRIKDFYRIEDDKVVFCKKLR